MEHIPTNHIAWTGGSRPLKLLEVSKQQRTYRSTLFRAAMDEVRRYWGDSRGLHNSVLESARTHYNHARYDAHATFRS